MSTATAAWMILKKDLRIEARTGEVLITTSLFALLIAVLTSLSFYTDPNTARRIASGVLWIAIAFAGVLAMGRSWSRERENETIRGLLLSPIPRAGIYIGKLLGSLVFLSVVEVLLTLVVALLFNLDLPRIVAPLAFLMILGSIGFAATGNLFAAMGVRTRARDMLLAVVVFPVVAPALLCGVVATRELLVNGATLSELASWIRILLAFDLAFVTAGIYLFEPLMTD
jgi:heme exporter protein B